MDGFGGQTWVYANSLTNAQADLFFSPTAGIGLQYVRTMNTADGSVPDLTTLQGAIARGAKVELGLQSPPCSIKHSAVDLGEACVGAGPQPAGWTDGSTGASGSCLVGNPVTSATWTTWANYIVSYINTFQNAPNNIPIELIDVQNEPDLTGGIGGCKLTASAFDTFVGTYLGPAIASMSGHHPKIMIASASDWFGTDLVSQCINDSNCAQYVSIVSGHGYGYPHSPSGVPSAVSTWLASSSSNHLWLSETGAQSGCDTGMTSGAGAAMTWAKNIHDMMTVANVSGLEWWELAYQATNCNFGLTDNSFNPSNRYYVEGQWSKFVGSGWVRIDTTANPTNEVYITAFKETTSGDFAIVVVNQNSAAVNVEFSLAGFPSVTSVTPTMTSASSNLEDQASVNISNGAFSYALPATSVVTFHGTASVATARPSAPTNLALTVL